MLGAIVGALVNALRNASPAGGAITIDSIQPLVNLVTFLAQFVQDVFQSADGNAGRATSYAQYAGDDIAQVADDLAAITDHTYQTVIPHSLAWLRGNIIITLVDPLRRLVAGINRVVKELVSWQAQIKVWRSSYVDPNVALWIGFRKWFYQWPVDALRTLHDWLTHPMHFGQWAVAPVTKAQIAYFATPAGDSDLYQLVGEYFDAAPERYRHVIGAFESILDQPWP